jgi:hypothetical protein
VTILPPLTGAVSSHPQRNAMGPTNTTLRSAHPVHSSLHYRAIVLVLIRSTIRSTSAILQALKVLQKPQSRSSCHLLYVHRSMAFPVPILSIHDKLPQARG